MIFLLLHSRVERTSPREHFWLAKAHLRTIVWRNWNQQDTFFGSEAVKTNILSHDVMCECFCIHLSLSLNRFSSKHAFDPPQPLHPHPRRGVKPKVVVVTWCFTPSQPVRLCQGGICIPVIMVGYVYLWYLFVRLLVLCFAGLKGIVVADWRQTNQVTASHPSPSLRWRRPSRPTKEPTQFDPFSEKHPLKVVCLCWEGGSGVCI